MTRLGEAEEEIAELRAHIDSLHLMQVRLMRDRNEADAQLAAMTVDRDEWENACHATDVQRDAEAQRASTAEARVAALSEVVAAVKFLRDSGYDGPFIGEVCWPIFSALAKLEEMTSDTQPSR